MFYKNRMAGNKERAKAANAKLVAENEHLLPKARASKKMASGAEKPLVGNAEMLKDMLDPLDQILARKQKTKRRLLVGGGVEEQMDVD